MSTTTSQLDVNGQTAVITGAGRGIGLAAATMLANHGARLVLADRDLEPVQTAATALDAVAWVGDITERHAADELIEHAVERCGSIDIIVNNAGFSADAGLHRMSDDEFFSMLDIHLVAPFRILRAAAPHLRNRSHVRPAKVVNVASVIGTMGAAGGANYAAAKAGLIGLTKSLAKEWARYAVCVNAVAFGYFDTRLSAELPDKIREAALASIPLQRFGTVEEAAAAILFLTSPMSDYITGQVLTVSGGVTLGMSS